MKRFLIRFALVAAFFAGCVADESVRRVEHNGLFSCSRDAAATPASPAAETGDSPQEAVADAGASTNVWTWEDVAVRAGRRCQAMKAGYFEAEMKRLKTIEDTAWKNPEFRYSHRWSDGESHRNSREYDTYWNRWLSSSTREADDRARANQFGVRFYIPNPFVDRYLRLGGDASVRRTEAKAAVDAFAVYSEVKLLCAEQARLDRELEYARHAAALSARVRDMQREAQHNAVAKSPFDLIRSEVSARRNALKLAEIGRERDRLLREIARLAELPLCDLRLAAGPAEAFDPDAHSVDELCEIAFARRPDLAQAIAELEMAEAAVGTARAETLPWFKFVEGAYRREHGREDVFTHATYDDTSARGQDRGTDWSVEVAITVPIFNWYGKAIRVSRSARDAAGERVKSLYGEIRQEVVFALEAYRQAVSDARLDEGDAFVKDMTRSISEYYRTSPFLAIEATKSTQELLEFLQMQNDARAAADEARINLETVLGGALPPPAE